MRNYLPNFLLICATLSAGACAKKVEPVESPVPVSGAVASTAQAGSNQAPVAAPVAAPVTAPVAAEADASAALPRSDSLRSPDPRFPAPAGSNQLSCTGSNGLQFTFRFGQPKVGELFAVDVDVLDAKGQPLADAIVLRADATMPEHGHGMMTKPETKQLAPGKWRSEGWKFNMHGKWQLVAEATGAKADRCTVNFEQPPETAL